jgi:tripartite-type tricarboxylate transporter receptor subunit TctC
VSDILARTIGRKLSDVKIETVSGDPIGALDFFMNTPQNDRSYLLLRPANLIAAMATIPGLLEKIQGVSLVANLGMVVVASGSSAPTDIAGLISMGRSKPVRFGTTGKWELEDVCVRQLSAIAGIPAEFVAYNGLIPTIDALLTSKADAACLPLAPVIVKQHIPGNRLKALAVTTATSHAQLPTVSTLEAQAIKGVAQNLWFVLVTHRSTNKSAMQPVVDAVKSVVEDEKFAQAMRGSGIDLVKTQEIGPVLADEFLRNQTTVLTPWAAQITQ